MKNLARFPVIITLAVVIGFGAAGCDFLFNDYSDEDDSNDSNNNSGTPNSTSSAYKWYGNGSANSFTISNATQLAEFAKIVEGTTDKDGPAQSDFKGKTVTLSADINLNNQWVPIGTSTSQFAGTFDGSGKKISGLFFSVSSYSSGLFGYVDEGGVVKNIVLTDISISGQYNMVGVVGINNGTVQNCNVIGSVTAGSYTIGGVVGNNRGTVQNCGFSGSVTGGNAGGVVGENSGRVQYCYATGSVIGNFPGGVVGENRGTVRDCYSTSSVNVKYSGSSYSGGVVGRNRSMVQNCYATGSVINNSGSIASYAGGIIGNNDGGTVQNCVALNPSINNESWPQVSTRTSRVVGSYGSCSNNYAQSGMTLTSGVTVIPDLNGSDGADVSASDYNSQEWWTTASNWNSASLWNFTTVWEWDSARDLPKLRMQ
jgi:hypothetical protein